jgi:AcrR family transcriptional regulator
VKQKKGIALDEANAKQAKRIHSIAKVSADLFSSKGYLETSMHDIAVAAKVTKGGVYHYFGSKTEILYFICSTYVDLDLENLEQSLSAIKGRVEKTKFIIFRHIDHYATHTSAAKTLLNEAYNLPPRYFREVKSREKKYFDIVAQVLSEYLGVRRKKPALTALTFTLFGMMNWIYSWYNPKGLLKPEELSSIIFETFTKGVDGASLSSRDEETGRGSVFAGIFPASGDKGKPSPIRRLCRNGNEGAKTEQPGRFRKF